jgi:crossover junction endodeoxyribonuclease RuvC
MADRQRILGIDPGSRLTGFGIVDCDRDAVSYVASGSINSIKGDFPARLRQIFNSMGEIVADYRPDVVAVESVFMHRNASSALKLGHARSAAICATFELRLDVVEYAPREIKQAIVGTGAATKGQVQHMVRHLLQLEGDPAPDAADALAAALCYANQRRINVKLGAAALVAGIK